MAKLISMSGDIKEVHPEGKYFTLKELYSLINCELVQVVPLKDGRSLWIDEEGKLHPHTENELATSMFHEFLLPGDYLTGNVLVDDEGEVD